MRTAYPHADSSLRDLHKSSRVAWWDCSRKKRLELVLTKSSGHRRVSAGLWCGITVADALGFCNTLVLFWFGAGRCFRQ